MRLWLALVVVAALLPLLALALLSAEAGRRDAIAGLRVGLREAAGRAALEEGLVLQRAIRVLNLTQGATSDTLCAAAVRVMEGQPIGIVAAAAYFPDGRPACGEAVADGGAVPSFSALRGALASGGRVVLATDPRAGLVLAREVAAPPGVVLGVALAESHLPGLPQWLAAAGGQRLLVDPGDGMVLAAAPPGEMRAGDHMHAPRLLAALRESNADGVVLARDAAGEERMLAHAWLPPMSSGPGATPAGAMVMSLPFDAALAQLDARRQGQWLLVLVASVVAAGAAWHLGERGLVRPAAVARAAADDRGAFTPGAMWLRQQADMAVVADFASEMFLRLDAGLRVVYASPATRAVLGYVPAEMMGAHLAGESSWDSCRMQLDEMQRSGGSGIAGCRLRARRKDDGEVWLEVRANRLSDGGFMLACRDVGAEQAAAQLLAETQLRVATLALEDPDTGLANRRRFDAALEQEVARARRAQEPLSLVLLRLGGDDAAGDGGKVARHVATVLAGALRRPGDVAARLDGLLFALLLPVTDRIGAQRVADRLRDSLAAGWSVGANSHADAILGPAAFYIGACSVLPLAEGQDGPAILALAQDALADAQDGRVVLRGLDEPPAAALGGALGILTMHGA